ncbi:MAG: putative toxin-antitoxin system toxin component, PIN family [Candidatus Bathyarchaeia archaeon]|jgi:putative PIN family toxin of toxin-antitoxin system
MLWGGKPAEIIKAAEKNSISILTSEEIIAEISQVLNYPKLKSIYLAEGLRSQDLIETVMKIAKFVKVTKKLNVIVGHPADDKFIECASAAGADYIISGDKHLLKVSCYKKTQIVPVNKFLQLIEAKR